MIRFIDVNIIENTKIFLFMIRMCLPCLPLVFYDYFMMMDLYFIHILY